MNISKYVLFRNLYDGETRNPKIPSATQSETWNRLLLQIWRCLK